MKLNCDSDDVAETELLLDCYNRCFA